MARLCFQATEQFRAARRLLPHWLGIRLGLGSSLSCAGRYREALQELHEAAALDPGSEAVKTAIAAIRAQEHNPRP